MEKEEKIRMTIKMNKFHEHMQNPFIIHLLALLAMTEFHIRHCIPDIRHLLDRFLSILPYAYGTYSGTCLWRTRFMHSSLWDKKLNRVKKKYQTKTKMKKKMIIFNDVLP